MLSKLATFLYANRRRVLLTAVVVVVIAGLFGLGVVKRLSPYGDTDPATQSVQATDRFEAATGRQIDPGVVALVRSGNVGSQAAQQRVKQVEQELRGARHRERGQFLRYPGSRDGLPRWRLDLPGGVLRAGV